MEDYGVICSSCNYLWKYKQDPHDFCLKCSGCELEGARCAICVTWPIAQFRELWQRMCESVDDPHGWEKVRPVAPKNTQKGTDTVKSIYKVLTSGGDSSAPLHGPGASLSPSPSGAQTNTQQLVLLDSPKQGGNQESGYLVVNNTDNDNFSQYFTNAQKNTVTDSPRTTQQNCGGPSTVGEGAATVDGRSPSVHGRGGDRGSYGATVEATTVDDSTNTARSSTVNGDSVVGKPKQRAKRKLGSKQNGAGGKKSKTTDQVLTRNELFDILDPYLSLLNDIKHQSDSLQKPQAKGALSRGMKSHVPPFGSNPKGKEADFDNTPMGVTDKKGATMVKAVSVASHDRPVHRGSNQYDRDGGQAGFFPSTPLGALGRGRHAANVPSTVSLFPGGDRMKRTGPPPSFSTVPGHGRSRTATITRPLPPFDRHDRDYDRSTEDDGAGGHSSDEHEERSSVTDTHDRDRSVEGPQEEGSYWPAALFVVKETFDDIDLHPQAAKSMSQRKAKSTRPEFLTLPLSRTARSAIEEVNKKVAQTTSLRSQPKSRIPTVRAAMDTFVTAPQSLASPKPDVDLSVFRRNNPIWKLNLQKAQVEAIQDIVHSALSPINYLDFLSSALACQVQENLQELPGCVAVSTCIAQLVEQLVKIIFSLTAHVDVAVRDAQLGMTGLSEDERIRLRRAPLFQETMFGDLPASMIATHTSSKTLNTMSQISSSLARGTSNRSSASALGGRGRGRGSFKGSAPGDSSKPFQKSQPGKQGSKQSGRGGFKGSKKWKRTD